MHGQHVDQVDVVAEVRRLELAEAGGGVLGLEQLVDGDAERFHRPAGFVLLDLQASDVPLGPGSVLTGHQCVRGDLVDGVLEGDDRRQVGHRFPDEPGAVLERDDRDDSERIPLRLVDRVAEERRAACADHVFEPERAVLAAPVINEELGRGLHLSAAARLELHDHCLGGLHRDDGVAVPVSPHDDVGRSLHHRVQVAGGGLCVEEVLLPDATGFPVRLGLVRHPEAFDSQPLVDTVDHQAAEVVAPAVEDVGELAAVLGLSEEHLLVPTVVVRAEPTELALLEGELPLQVVHPFGGEAGGEPPASPEGTRNAAVVIQAPLSAGPCSKPNDTSSFALHSSVGNCVRPGLEREDSAHRQVDLSL